MYEHELATIARTAGCETNSVALELSSSDESEEAFTKN